MLRNYTKAKEHINVSIVKSSSCALITLKCIELMVAVPIHKGQGHYVTFVEGNFVNHKSLKFTLRECTVVSFKAFLKVFFGTLLIMFAFYYHFLKQIWLKSFVIFNVNCVQNSWDHEQHFKDTRKKYIVEIQQLLVVHVAKSYSRIVVILRFIC